MGVLPVYVSVYLMHALPIEARIPWNWSLAIMWKLLLTVGPPHKASRSQFRITAPHYNLWQIPLGFSS